jgi:septal ring factor EnvC (AmiA/AmiB activator)
VATWLVAAAGAQAQQLDAVLQAQAEADRAAAASQERIDRLRDATQDAAARYREARAEADSLDLYNSHLSRQLAAQASELASIRKQLAEIETTQREIHPLMERMLDTLEQFIALDVPFLLEERTRRAQTLREMMNRADVSISEKYRRILEAYQIELEYGRTLEAYEGGLGEGEAERTVHFVRLGRISLLYQTLDGRETGYWDGQRKSWVRDDDYAQEVREALRVARKAGAPGLLIVPVPPPKDVAS